MAFTAREVIMTFRGQNYLSSSLRRIGTDVASLSRNTQLANQKAMLQTRRNQLQYTRAIAQAESSSIANGARSLALQNARAKLSVTEYQNLTRLRTIEERRMQNDVRQLQTQERLNAVTRAQASGQTFIGRGANRQKTSVAVDIQQREMHRLTEEAQSLNRAWNAQQQILGGASLRAQQLAAREAELVQRNGQLQQRILSVNHSLAENELAMRRVNFEAEKIAPIQAWHQRATAISHAAGALQRFGLITTATMGFAADQAAKFSSQFTLAATQARPAGAPASATAQISREVQQRVMGMMQQFPASAEQMAQSFYEIFSGTNIQQVDKAAEAVKTFNMMAIAGGADLKTMTDAGISMFNNFGGLDGEFRSMDEAANAFFATVRFGRMNALQWAQAMPFVLSVAKEAGLTYRDVSEVMAAATRQTGARYTGRDAQGLARLIQLFGRADVAAGLAGKGIDVFDKATGRMRPTLQIVKDIHDNLNLTNAQALNFFKIISANKEGKGGTQGTIQAIRLFGFLYQNIRSAEVVSRQVRSSSDEMIRSFEVMAETPGVKWATFVNQMKVLVYTIGTQAIPIFVQLGQPLIEAVKWFNSLGDSSKSLVATLLTFGGIGAMVAGVFLGIASAIAKVVTQVMLMRRMRALEDMVAFERASSALSTPVIASPGIINPRTGATFSQAQQAGGRPSNEAGFARPGAVLGLTAVSVAAATLPLLAMNKQVDEVIDKLGGMSTVFLTIGIAATINAIKTSTAWTMAYARSAAASKAFAIAAETGATGVATANQVAATATARAWKAALISTGWGIVILAASFAAAYVVTHWEKTQKWFRLFWAGLKGESAATWEFLKQTARGGAYAILQYATAAVRGMLKAATYIPGIRGQAKQTLADLQNMLQGFKPDFSKISGMRMAPILAERRRQAQEEQDKLDQAQALKAENARWQTIARFWDAKNAAAARNASQARLDRSAGIAPGASNVRTVQQWIAYVQRARRAMLGSPGDFRKALLFEKAQAALNKRFKDQPALLAAINDVLQNYTSNLKANESAAERAAKAADKRAAKQQAAAIKQQTSLEDVMQGVRSMYQNIEQQQQQAFGEFGQGPFINRPWTQAFLEWGGKLSIKDYMRDSSAQIKQYKERNKLLANLAKRGAPAELLNTLSQQGIEVIRTFASATDPELQRYFKMFQTAQDLIHEQTLKQLKRQLDDYRQHGRDIALQIVAGLRDENEPLTKTLKNMISSAFGKLPPTQAQIDKAAEAATNSARKEQVSQKEKAVIATATRSKALNIPTSVAGTVNYNPPPRPSSIPASVSGTISQGMNIPGWKDPWKLGSYPSWYPKWLRAQIPPVAKKVAHGVLAARERGGPITAGTPYIVGEKGPEVVVPKHHGNVIPNHGVAQAIKTGLGFLGRHAAHAVVDPNVAAYKMADRISKAVIGENLKTIVSQYAGHGGALRIPGAAANSSNTLRSVSNLLRTPMTVAEKEATKAPGIWYHGSQTPFNRFSRAYNDPNALFGPGMYFTNNPKIAAGYTLTKHGQVTKAAQPNIRAHRLMINNPFVMEHLLTNETIKRVESTLRREVPARLFPVGEIEKSRLQEMLKAGRITDDEFNRIMGPNTKATRTYYGGQIKGTHIERIRDQIIEDVTQGSRPTNQKFYRQLVNATGGNRAAVNRILQQAGFDAIQHVGGKIVGKKLHDVTIAFGGSQVRPHYWRGGEIPGMAGKQVDIAAHAGETILTKTHRALLSRILIRNVDEATRIPKTIQPRDSAPSPRMSAPSRPTEEHTHYHVNVTGGQDEASVKAQIRHADFAKRNKYRPSR